MMTEKQNDAKCAPVERQVGRQKRLAGFDGDFRRSPKTQRFCAVCQRDLKLDSKIFYVYLGTPYCDCVIVHPDDATDEIVGFVGSECRKRIAAGFLMNTRPTRSDGYVKP